MDAILLAAVLAITVPKPVPPDFETLIVSPQVDLDSPILQAQMLAAMAVPYKYGVTQMPCRAQEWQPDREWRPAREPSGRIQWVVGPVTTVRWSGIYGTCFIQSPFAREKLDQIERTALECVCNGWLPQR